MFSRPRTSRLGSFAALGAACLSFATVSAVRAQTAVLTQDNNNARTGANTHETALTPATVNVAHFGKLFTIPLNANVNGQVLYVPHVNYDKGGIHNTIYAYTSNNVEHSPCALYAFDADNGDKIWGVTLPNSAEYTTATPVIDRKDKIIYVLTKTEDENGATFLHAFDTINGQEMPGSPIRVKASVPGTGDGNVDGVVSFDGPASTGRFHANDRAGLLFANGMVYTSFAHNTDSYPYHGWVLAYKYDGTKFTQTAKFCTTPNGSDGGVWMAGKGITADAAGNIYFSIGNGTFDVDTKGISSATDYAMCYMKLSPSLEVLDWFAPYDELYQSNQDLDLGNTGVTFIPGTDRLFGGGTKFGTGFLLDSTDLGHFTPGGPDDVVLRLDGITGNDSVGQNPIAWNSGTNKYVYLWAMGSELEQFQYDPAVRTFSPAGVFDETTNKTSGGSLAISSNGTQSPILWAVGNDNVVRAFDASDVTKREIWNSAMNASRDKLDSVGHFQFPTVVNGKVYVPSGSATIVVYGLF